MNPRKLFLACIAIISAAAPARAQDIPLAAAVERYLDARGGLERIRAVRTLILRGAPRADGKPGRFMAKARPYYWRIGEPSPRDYAEGFDGSHWEFYEDPGLVIRPTGAPAAAGRHTAYFDDPLVYFGELGWSFERLADARIGDEDAYGIRATMPDGYEREYYLSKRTWLVTAIRASAPIHAFGAPVRTETRVADYRPVNGALFPMRFDEYDIDTGKLLEKGTPWATAEANVALPLNYFAPPEEPATPLARMVNGAYASRGIAADAMLWYNDFKRNPATAGIETEAAIEGTAYQMLKAGTYEAAIALLEANLKEHPRSAAAQFGLGRAYRAAGREKDALAAFQAAVAIDPAHEKALQALKQAPR